ncbi:hypothetical protein BY996DRAFT_4342792 [Phakopsora pachyrhizi]|nr:hypothetical protein BY996DRAFT_4342792 [Phakopsora pachyrhizi]
MIRRFKIKSINSQESSESESESESESDSEQIDKAEFSLGRANKNYLDPQLFASASQALAQSRKASQEREHQSRINSAKTVIRKKKLLEPQDCQEIGNNTTVAILSQSDHLAPSSRPTSASNFARNRLYTKANKMAISLPKATIEAKSAMGTRRSPFSSMGQLRKTRPDLFFSKS